MTFENDKKTFLKKQDKSKKGGMDEKIMGLVHLINSSDNYYTTSSCSGRVYLWRGSTQKNEMERLKVSHDLIDEQFLETNERGLVWLRMEPLIMHIACRDLNSANSLLEEAKRIYKKSSLLGIQNKIILEIRGSEFIEIPLYYEGKLLFKDLALLKELVNGKLERIWERAGKFRKLYKNSRKKTLICEKRDELVNTNRASGQ